MPVYRMSKQDRLTIMNVSAETHDKARALIEAQRAKHPPADSRHHLSWYNALRAADPSTTQHPELPANIADNGHHDHGEFHTMTLSLNMARILTAKLGVELTFHHDIHHVPPPAEKELTP